MAWAVSSQGVSDIFRVQTVLCLHPKKEQQQPYAEEKRLEIYVAMQACSQDEVLQTLRKLVPAEFRMTQLVTRFPREIHGRLVFSQEAKTFVHNYKDGRHNHYADHSS